jgi:hypothetical protein
MESMQELAIRTMNSYIRIVATVFPRNMVCLRNISVDTLYKGDTEDNNKDIYNCKWAVARWQ